MHEMKNGYGQVCDIRLTEKHLLGPTGLEHVGQRPRLYARLKSAIIIQRISKVNNACRDDDAVERLVEFSCESFASHFDSRSVRVKRKTKNL